MTREEYEKIEKTLFEKNVYGEIYQNEKYICISIEHGDWKHEHLRCDYLMNKLGYQLIDEQVTFEDGSDNYSSIHIYTN